MKFILTYSISLYAFDQKKNSLYAVEIANKIIFFMTQKKDNFLRIYMIS